MKYFLIYLLIINLFAFALMGFDKNRARKNKWRIPERRLFLACILGGSLGSIFGMKCFHHKTKHWYFKYGMPAILLGQIALVIFLYYKGFIKIG